MRSAVKAFALLLALMSPASAQSIQYWTIDANGVISITGAGAQHFNAIDAGEVYDLQVSAANAGGSGLGVVRILVSPGNGYLIACCPGVVDDILVTDTGDHLLAQ